METLMEDRDLHTVHHQELLAVRALLGDGARELLVDAVVLQLASAAARPGVWYRARPVSLLASLAALKEAVEWPLAVPVQQSAVAVAAGNPVP
jgi:hypothetical protein